MDLLSFVYHLFLSMGLISFGIAVIVGISIAREYSSEKYSINSLGIILFSIAVYSAIFSVFTGLFCIWGSI